MHKLHFILAATIMLTFFNGPTMRVQAVPSPSSVAIATTSALQSTLPEMHAGYGHKNIATYEHAFETNQKKQYRQQYAQSHANKEASTYQDYENANSNEKMAVEKNAHDVIMADIPSNSERRNYHTGSNHNNGMTRALIPPTPSSSSSSSETVWSPTATATNLDAMHYNGMDTSFGVVRHITAAIPKQQIPIYEEQHDDEPVPFVSAAGSTGYGNENNQQTIGYRHSNFIPSPVAPPTALPESTTPFRALSSSFWSNSYHTKSLPTPLSSPMPSTPQYYHHNQQQQQQQQQQQERNFLQSTDKISDGNFLHHYEHNSQPFNELNANEQHYEQYQQDRRPKSIWPYSNTYNYLQSPAGHGGHGGHGGQNILPAVPPSLNEIHQNIDDQTNNYLNQYQQLENLDNQHEQDNVEFHHNIQQPQQQHHQTDVINYIPYPVVKKQHVPVHQPVQIPISHAVIVPISKPVPIQIPVAQQVQIPVEKELKIPVERIVPFPVEKHVPVPVEKRVPYPVVKYVPVKVPRPFPVKVPVFKTILHKVKGGWW